jgi:hypothetical protein
VPAKLDPLSVFDAATAILDCACTEHVVPDSLGLPSQSSPPIHFSQPDGSFITSTSTATLPLEHLPLPSEALIAHVMPNLITPLVSLGQLTDYGCQAYLNDRHAFIIYKGKIIMTGSRDRTDGLWRLRLPDRSTIILTGSETLDLDQWRQPRHSSHSCNALVPRYTVAQRVAYLHACLGSPALSTLHQALKSGYLKTIPMTSEQVNLYPPQSVAMWKGHMDQTRKNQRSTRPIHDHRTLNSNRTMFISLLTISKAAVRQAHRKGTVYSDLTGRFITESSQGNNYILVVYDADSNHIFAEPLASRHASAILAAYKTIHATILKSGAHPLFHITDNEAAQPLLAFLEAQRITYQLVPPHNHRANAAERAIRTFKNHFIAILSSTDPDFPLNLWDRLIPQAIMTLNLLRASGIDPSKSAHEQIHGAYNFDRHPIGPPGTAVLVHDKPSNRGTWAPHGTKGWYIGPAMNHYRSFTVYIPTTSSTRVTDTIAWFPKHVVMPATTPSAIAITAAQDLTQALLQVTTTPSQRATLLQLAEIFASTFNPTCADATITSLNPTTTLSTLSDGADVPRVPPVPVDQRAPPKPSPLKIRFADPLIQPTHLVPPLETISTPTHRPSILKHHDSVPVAIPPQSYTNFNHNAPQRRRRARVRQTVQPPPATATVDPRVRAPRDQPRVMINKKKREAQHGTSSFHGRKPLPPEPRVTVLPDVAPPPATALVPATMGKTGMRLSRRQQRLRFDPKTHRAIPLGSNTSYKAHALVAPQQQTQSYTDSWLQQEKQMNTAIKESASNIDNWTGQRHPVRQMFQALMTARAAGDSVHHASDEPEEKLTYRSLLKGRAKDRWTRASEMEFGRLAQGMPGLVDGTDTMWFIPHFMKPSDRIASYCRFVCAYNELKAEQHRVRMTYGGDRTDYIGDVSTAAIDATAVKVHLNSIISTPGARHLTIDIKNFYLGTPLERFEYMRIAMKDIPASVITHYDLHALEHDGHVMVEIRKGIYGLPQAGLLAKQLLDQRLLVDGYYPAPNTPGLYLHTSRPISFTLWVDDFSIKYIKQEDAHHLLATLSKHYEVKPDWSGTKYLGLTLRWNYAKRWVDVSMLGYIRRALLRFAHPMPSRPQHAPHLYTAPKYGPGAQYAPDQEATTPLDATDVKKLQQVLGVLLFYARMVDNTLLVDLNILSSQQSNATDATMTKLTTLLNYCATYPDAIIRYKASDMILHIVSDASYLSASESRSRLGGYFYLSNMPVSMPPTATDPPPPFNGPVLVTASIIKAVLSSAAEAELGALFYNAKEGCEIRNTLEDLGHKQPPTPIQADNACAVGLSNNTLKQKRSKAMDMRFYWIRDRVAQRQFVVYWRKGSDNDADYFTKQHPPAHHRLKRSRFIQVNADD